MNPNGFNGPKLKVMEAMPPLIPGSERDGQLVSEDGREIISEIQGVDFRPVTTQADERGSLTEVFSASWGFSDAAVVHIYRVTVFPGQSRGSWVTHLHQTDRLHFSEGCARVALYDNRPDSPTHGVLSVRHLGAHKPGLLTIPPGVYHAIRNVGVTALTFVNLPTAPYEHRNPDKYRLPEDTPEIPFRP